MAIENSRRDRTPINTSILTPGHLPNLCATAPDRSDDERAEPTEFVQQVLTPPLGMLQRKVDDPNQRLQMSDHDAA